MAHPHIFPHSPLLVSYLPMFILYPPLLYEYYSFYSLQELKILISKLFWGLGYLYSVFHELTA